MYQLTKSSKQDIKQIAHCQMQCFEKSFSTRLGFAYMVKSLEWFLAGDNRFLLQVSSDESVVGYCGGFISKGPGDGSTSGMMQYAMREAAIGMLKRPGLFFCKEIIPFYPLIFRNVFRKIFSSQKKQEAPASPGALASLRQGLVVIGVLPAHRGKGVFELLMNGFEKEAQSRDIHKLGLSVKKENLRAIQAYKKCGWGVGNELTDSWELIKEL